MNFNYKFGVIGYGNMANAILNGIIKSKFLNASQIAVFETDETKREQAKNNGMNVLDGNIDIFKNCEYILFSVKPQSLSEILNEVKGYDCGNVIISIMAGIKKSEIKEKLTTCKVVRCMPNTPAMISEGMTAIDISDVEAGSVEFVKKIFDLVGKSIILPEDKMNEVTAISGSGPAYIYMFIQSMIEAGKKLGLSEQEAKLLTIQTFIGASKMVESSNEPLDMLIEKVCSKGGTTIEAVNSMRNDDLKNIIEKAIQKCYNRAVDLSKGK